MWYRNAWLRQSYAQSRIPTKPAGANSSPYIPTIENATQTGGVLRCAATFLQLVRIFIILL